MKDWMASYPSIEGSGAVKPTCVGVSGRAKCRRARRHAIYQRRDLRPELDRSLARSAVLCSVKLVQTPLPRNWRLYK